MEGEFAAMSEEDSEKLKGGFVIMEAFLLFTATLTR